MNGTNAVPIDVDKELYPSLIQCFFIIGAGYVAGQLNLVTNAQSTGLSRFISHFALPAIIFKNLVDVKFESISWQFLATVFIAKTIVFIGTAIVTGIGERPRSFASMGLYAIMTTQTNDFAIIAPIIDAVYKQSHPEYQRYIYLIAPINLVILNPIGFLLIEIQNRLDERQKNPNISIWHRCYLIRKILSNIVLNPIVICTILGVIFNRIFHEQLPDILEAILTPIAQSFNATALFYLGLTMVGKLRQLHARVVITVLLLSMIKLIIFPLILRQAVFLLVKQINGSFNNTIDYSNFGFLYGLAPTAPSVMFYVPASNLALQAIASTGLVVSTLLAGPIMIVSAKMINLKTSDAETTQAYETDLVKTAYDVSFISLFCTIIVLIGFCLRRRLLKISYIHKYTFIFVGLQMVHAIWTISVQFIKPPISSTDSMIISLGSILIALTTRTWVTSLSIILMISVCYPNDRARRYFWLYHLYGWFLPIFVTLIIYLTSLIDKSKDHSMVGHGSFATLQTSIAILLLGLCLIINSANLLRIARRTYRLTHDAHETRRISFTSGEIRPLINYDSDTQQSHVTIQSLPRNTRPFEGNAQLLRHAVLIGVLSINAFICLSVLSWSLLDKNRDGIYYELQFFDTVLLHGQGIVTFLIFALDADLLLPISRRIIKLLNYFGLKVKSPRNNNRSSQHNQIIDFEFKIRPDFIRYSLSTQSINSSTETIGTVFNGKDFCQWLVSNDHMENESKAQTYCRELITNKQIICINRTQSGDSINQWYAFSK